VALETSIQGTHDSLGEAKSNRNPASQSILAQAIGQLPSTRNQGHTSLPKNTRVSLSDGLFRPKGCHCCLLSHGSHHQFTFPSNHLKLSADRRTLQRHLMTLSFHNSDHSRTVVTRRMETVDYHQQSAFIHGSEQMTQSDTLQREAHRPPPPPANSPHQSMLEVKPTKSSLSIKHFSSQSDATTLRRYDASQPVWNLPPIPPKSSVSIALILQAQCYAKLHRTFQRCFAYRPTSA
jgi:hypothetical protein